MAGNKMVVIGIFVSLIYSLDRHCGKRIRERKKEGLASVESRKLLVSAGFRFPLVIKLVMCCVTFSSRHSVSEVVVTFLGLCWYFGFGWDGSQTPQQNLPF
jgi:hypothetical protein